MPKMSQFTRFSRGKIWFVDIGPCKRFDIFQLCFCLLPCTGTQNSFRRCHNWTIASHSHRNDLSLLLSSTDSHRNLYLIIFCTFYLKNNLPPPPLPPSYTSFLPPPQILKTSVKIQKVAAGSSKDFKM